MIADHVTERTSTEPSTVSNDTSNNTDSSSFLQPPPSLQTLTRSQSFAHLSPDTAFIIHANETSDYIDITPISTNNPSSTTLRPCRSAQPSTKRPSIVSRLFRSQSATILPHDSNDGMSSYNSNTNNDGNSLYRNPTLNPTSYPNRIVPLEESDIVQQSNHEISSRSIRVPGRSESVSGNSNSSSILSRPTSRFSFVTRHSSNLRPMLSRPPTYKRYDNPEQEEQQARDMEALRRLEHLYNQEQNNGILHQLFSSEGDSFASVKSMFVSFITSQFTGFYMAFWVIVLVFVGAVSVFVPGLPPVAKLLWLPLGLYCLGVFFFFSYHQRHAREVFQLERQVSRARRRRLNELLRNMELPNDHYFVIEQRASSGHPVMTLLPPPPNYGSTVRTTDQIESCNIPMVQIPSQQETVQEENDDDWQISQAEETMDLETSREVVYNR
ncbi:uncharacterized protein BX664DRAFT_343300 [Halteromyces radiatus]|uniref:uncharacterized protein n=1 Tax=Halteromyces radiatus TaxID=101107 RepID=UPI0022202BD7|nr:uncharacterized protein BX664DRAFT_343300 [Halteromyces radiatus]KAI8077711.1 hypothetical protein BX664DRAFT_343300 [Halteromyces radiatus]